MQVVFREGLTVHVSACICIADVNHQHPFGVQRRPIKTACVNNGVLDIIKPFFQASSLTHGLYSEQVRVEAWKLGFGFVLEI